INDHYIDGLTITNFRNLIPNKLIAFKKGNYSIIVLELYSFSYSTVGSCYIYECFKLNKDQNVIEKKMLEKKLPMKKSKYLRIF
ncbi:hypothetical protein DBB36_14615, partial [Flavobacterium sp. WLB]|uniref:hypothetical protein n=2 Tax=Flavobacterium TaxID=237 RepID=UPI000DE7971E